MNTHVVVKVILLYSLITFVTYHVHWIVERHFYMTCRETLWKTYTGSMSPYCLFLGKSIKVIETTPQLYGQKLYTIFLGPLLQILNQHLL